MAADFPRFGELAGPLVANGYRPLPIPLRQKSPGIDGWPDFVYHDTDHGYDTWGTGILCGAVVGLDIDVRVPEIAAQMRAYAEENLGLAPARIGQAPKVLLVYRVLGDPFAKLQTVEYRLPGDEPDAKGHKVEVLAKGQQFVGWNVHESTKRPYTWNGHGDLLDTPAARLSEVTREQLVGYIEWAAAILSETGRPLSRQASTVLNSAAPHTPRGSQRADDIDKFRSALAACPNDGVDYDSWVLMAYAIKGAIGDAGHEDWLTWSRKSSKHRDKIAEKTWRGATDPKAGAGTVFHTAMQNGWKFPAKSPRVPRGTRPPESVPDGLPPIESYVDDPKADAAAAVLIGLSDDELALRFSARHADRLRYVASWDRWLIWDGMRWGHDEKRKVFDFSRELCRDVLDEHINAAPLTQSQRAALRKHMGSAQRVYAVVKLAGSDPHHSVSVADLDSDPWLLNTPGGIVDLRTGLTAPHDPQKLCTKITAAPLGGECPKFLQTLAYVQPDVEMRDYIQRLFGYGMTGSCRDHALSFWWGSGRNGKGTIAHAFRRAIGDYGLEVGSELFMEAHHDRHPTEIAVLRGARFVAASEIDTGRRWNEARLKRLTGGDPISARYIGKDLFEFEPTHTLLIIGNSKPGLTTVDEAMRARMHLVEFSVTVPESERDTGLSEALEGEYGGILAWALEGCRAWQQKGLSPPAAVREATAAYLDSEDSVAQWIAECCLRSGTLTLAAAHKSYREWCEINTAPALGRNHFADQLAAHGCKREASGAGKRSPRFTGLSLPIEAENRYSDRDNPSDDDTGRNDSLHRRN